MSAPQPTLDQLQRWMLPAITDPAAVAKAGGLEEFILPSRRQSAAERLAVYHNAYFARLLEVLRELFPCTRFAVGDELFDRFAVGYLQAHPPHSYTLARLADKLVEFLENTRPADWGGFVVELARLEQAIDRIFDGPGPEELPPFDASRMIAAAGALEAAESLQLRFVPSFELHAFDFPVSTFYTDWKAGRDPAWSGEGAQFVALLRRDYIVRRHELTAVQFQLLSALHGGAALGEALAAAAELAGDESPDKLAHDVHDWFTRWAAERFFA